MRPYEIGGEIGRLLRARPLQTVLVGGLAAATVVSVLLTVGRTVALEEAVHARIETPEARMILIVDTGSGGLIRSETVRTLARMEGVDRVVATTSPVDAVNLHLGEGSNAIPVWGVTGDLSGVVTLQSGRLPGPGEAIVSETAMARVGLAGRFGALLLPDGRDLSVVGTYRPRHPFTNMAAGALWQVSDQSVGLRSLQIVVVTVPQINAVTARAVGLFDASTLGDLRVERAAALVELQELLAGDVSQFGRELVALVLLAGMLLVALVVLSEVLSRRKDFGRQRALGARRSTVIALLAVRTAASAAIGSSVGLAVALAYLNNLGELPSLSFVFGLVALAILAPPMAAIGPAWWAARRDPVLELRTP